MISGADFLALQTLLQQRCGMALTSDKLYLVAARLGPVAQRLGHRSVIELMASLRTRPSEAAINAVVEAMVTHESLFFRDGKPFEQLRALLPDLMRARASERRIRIWSAACSSGQEAYSIAMQIAEEYGHIPAWHWEIIGTDVSQPIVDKARHGEFSAFEAKRGLTEARLARHFEPRGDGGWRVKPSLRAMTQFRMHNLLESAAHLGRCDIVFCRNVLIYFDAPTKTRALDVIARQMAADGALFLGAADSVAGISDKFQNVDRGLFKLAQPVLKKSA